jgi:hypothetical protein
MGDKKADDEQKLTKPVFELIKENLDPERGLPANFAIPGFRSQGPSRRVIWLMRYKDDGSVEYDGPKKNAPALMSDELLSMIAGACEGQNNEDAIISYLHDNVLYQYRIHGYIDPLLDVILSGSPISREKLLFVALRWASESPDVELTRLGLAILSVFDLRNDPECREVILTLGCFYDFTGYALDAVRDWPDGNDIVFDLASKTHGYGKEDAVKRLEVKTERIKNWIIKHGCENMTYDGYLVLTCAEKGGLLSHLKREKLDDECFDGICVIMYPMIEEDLIRYYKRHRETVKLFVNHAGRRDLSVENLIVLLEVYENYRSDGKAKRGEKHSAMKKKCGSILRSGKSREKNNNGAEKRRIGFPACQTAHALRPEIGGISENGYLGVVVRSRKKRPGDVP